MTTMGKVLQRRKWWLVLLLAVCAAAVGWGIWGDKGDETVAYQQISPQRGDIVLSILATGTVQPENRLEIKAPIPGRIERVLVQEGQNVRKGQILAWMSSTERAALLDAARSRGVEEVRRWEELYRPTAVIAPISGTIILRSVEAGQTFSSSDSIMVMSDRLTVKAQVDETDIAQVNIGQGATIVLDAYQQSEIVAKVDRIAFDAQTISNVTTYVVDVLPATSPEFMRSGMTANVTFFVDSRSNVLTLPNQAIKAEAGEFFVLVANGNGKPKRRSVVLGITDGKNTELISGINEGEIILAAQMPDAKNERNLRSPLTPMGGGGGGGRR